MNTQVLSDRNLRPIGYIDTRSDGIQYLRGTNNQPLGYYNPKTNQTHDNNNRLVGHGNVLTALLNR